MAPSAKAVSFMVADAFPVFCDGLVSDLPKDFPKCSVEIFDTVVKLMQSLNRFNKTIVFLGTNICNQPADEISRELLKQHEEVKLIIVANMFDRQMMERMFSAGALGCLTYHDDKDEIEYCVKRVMKGETYESRFYIEEKKRNGESAEENGYRPTPKQREVLQLLVKGMINKQIAEEMNCSVYTVNGHMSNLRKNTNTHNRVELQNYAREKGWV